MNLARLPATAIAAAIGAALFVLPGLGVRALLRRPYRRPLDELLVVVGTSTMVTAALGALLLGFRCFSPLIRQSVCGEFCFLPDNANPQRHHHCSRDQNGAQKEQYAASTGISRFHRAILVQRAESKVS